MRRPASDPLPGLVIAARFRIDRVHPLGGGRCVTVARDDRSGEEVALRLAADRDDATTLESDGRWLSRVRHPNVARLVDRGACADTGLLYLAVEHVPGLSLGRYLDLRAPVSGAELRVVSLGLAAALAELHRRGIGLGGQLDDADVVVGWEHGLRRPVIVGFGGARAADPREDVRAVGTLLHRIAYGASPGGLRMVPASENPRLDAVISRCLSDDRDQRPASGGVLARELAAALDDA